MPEEKDEIKIRQYKVDDETMIYLNTCFTYHSPKADQPQRYQIIRTLGKEFARTVLVNCPNSREKSLALTKIEEAVMWANTSIARGE